ncbi:DsrE family protein [Lacticaseibacillus kribbianus]|uniref:DsrE family protein n=1 Tax=Lacticaseibacillus kribbianus TaxID=2926292 RepID=UPI001CD31EB3|nr:DsrE family protein [Lacticaseibacillus kribbianus]
MNVIFHLDEPAKWPVVTGNIVNYLKAAADQGVSGQVELLINGPAIEGARRGSDQVLAPLLEAGVEVAACANAMASHQIAAANLQPGLTVVPAGVFELARRQHEGYAYIRP